MTLNELCTELNNWDFNARATKVFAKFAIVNGQLEEDTLRKLGLKHGQYYRIVGSLFNDGVHVNDTSVESLIDEEYDGAVWLMAIPPEVLKLVEDITAWELKNADALNNVYTSESFAGYSYTKDANKATWQKAFKDRLSRWRKI